MVIWVPKKSREYGFVAEVDQMEVDETADAIVLRGHGPKVNLLDQFQLDMGTSKYIYLVGHSLGKVISGYTAKEIFDLLVARGLKNGITLKVMACNAGMINGFVMLFRQQLGALYSGVDVKGVDRIVSYTKDNKFLYTAYPPTDTSQYDQDSLRKKADDDLVTKTWQALRAEFEQNPDLLTNYPPFYARFGVKKQDVTVALAKIGKDSGAAWGLLLAKIEKYIGDYAGPKLAVDLFDAIKANPDMNSQQLESKLNFVHTEFKQRVAQAWQQKKDWLRKHHLLDVEPMSGPQRLKKAHDLGKGDPRPYLAHI